MSEWTKVPGYDYIEVTRCGRVRSAEQTVMRMTRWGKKHPHVFKARELRQAVSDNGYLRVVTSRDGKRGPIYVHRLIALAFVAGYIPGYHVNHINGSKLDNRPENLEWVPNATNVRHAWRTGLCKPRKLALTPARVRAIRRLLALGAPTNTVAVAAAVSPAAIWKIGNGQTWQSVNELGIEDEVS